MLTKKDPLAAKPPKGLDRTSWLCPLYSSSFLEEFVFLEETLPSKKAKVRGGSSASTSAGTEASATSVVTEAASEDVS